MRHLTLIIILLIQTGLLHSQKIEITGDSLLFNEVITRIEKQAKFKFFYKTDWINEVYITGKFSFESPTEAINWISKTYNLNYDVVNKNKIIFLKEIQLKTNYIEEYLNKTKTTKNSLYDSIEYYKPQNLNEEENNISNEYLLFEIGNVAKGKYQSQATLGGKITDIETGEPLVGATVFIEDLKIGTITNAFGYYSISIPKGRYKILYRLIGMKTTFRNIVINSDGALDVEMKTTPTSLKEVVVKAKNEDPLRNLRMGISKLSMKTLKQLPSGMGESDVIKTTLLLPGVQSVGEAASGFNVRGGGTDQNLILFNDAPIVNTSHFFGFFSGFNSETIKDITLYKSGIPARFGGRVSSVMDITLKEGNRKQLKVYGGISPVSGKLVAESPIIKDKSSFIIGARTTYSDWILGLLDNGKLKKSKAIFYDLQGNFSYDLNKDNSIYISGYYSYDKFDYYTEDAFEYKTMASTIKWKHVFNPKLFSTFSAVVSNYDYILQSRVDSSSLHSIEYSLNQYSFKADFSYNTSNNHKIEFGASSTWYDLSPGKRMPISNESIISAKIMENENALETALYLSDEFDINNNISIAAGLRYSFYSNFGPKKVFNYEPNSAKNINTITDTTNYESGEPITSYSGPEFRILSNIRLSNDVSLKLGYNRMYQYIQMISNTASMSPTDIWKLSDKYLKPQIGDQVSLGVYTKFKQEVYSASAEVYYKKLKNIIDYKGGANLIMNEHLETDVLNGDGKAYGIELMVQKKAGRLTGWINYTYSKILHRINGEHQEEKVNNGDYFPANYDKPNNFKLVTNYKVSRRFNFSCNFLYSTGRPFTPPASYYEFGGALRTHYVERNSVRMPDYLRLDLAATINGNLVAKKLNHSSFTFAVYNVLGRKNAYNIFFRTEEGRVNGYKMSIFGRPIFTVTYNFKILGNAKDDF